MPAASPVLAQHRDGGGVQRDQSCPVVFAVDGDQGSVQVNVARIQGDRLTRPAVTASRLINAWWVAACSGLASVPAAWMSAEISSGEYRYGVGRMGSFLIHLLALERLVTRLSS